MGEIEDELALHIDMRAYELERDGLSPAAARTDPAMVLRHD